MRPWLTVNLFLALEIYGANHPSLPGNLYSSVSSLLSTLLSNFYLRIGECIDLLLDCRLLFSFMCACFCMSPFSCLSHYSCIIFFLSLHVFRLGKPDMRGLLFKCTGLEFFGFEICVLIASCETM